ncbi:MAG: family 10 glycosylhydrolase, partial [Oscillospiraceae bacterium]
IVFVMKNYKKQNRIMALLLMIALSFFVSCKESKVSAAKPENGKGQDNLSYTIFKDGERQDMSVAVWVSYLDLKEMLKNPQDASARIDDSIKTMKSFGVTDVYFHVRQFGDALYRSEVFPSAECTVYDDIPENFLKSAVESAHANKIRIHAWINPYRLFKGESETYKSFLSRIEKLDSRAVLRTGSTLMLNPASAEARKLVVNGVEEIIGEYEVDGIHLDDYFYPADIGNLDSEDFKAYVKGGGTLGINEWRRENVSCLIREVYAAVHEDVERKLVFGISPDASIERDFNSHFCDVELWCANEGYVDYICPQIYYGYENETMPFLSVLAQWEKICKKVDLIAGLGFYKAGAVDKFAGVGSGEWQKNIDIIARQYKQAEQSKTCLGVALYRYESVFAPSGDSAAVAVLERYNLEKAIGGGKDG